MGRAESTKLYEEEDIKQASLGPKSPCTSLPEAGTVQPLFLFKFLFFIGVCLWGRTESDTTEVTQQQLHGQLTNSGVIVSGEQRRDSATHTHVFSSVTQLCPTLRPHELQHARPPCPSPTRGVYSNSCTCIHSPPNLPSIQVATFIFNAGKFLTPLPMCCGSFPTPGNSPAPPGCPTIQLKSDTVYPEVASYHLYLTFQESKVQILQLTFFMH